MGEDIDSAHMNLFDEADGGVGVGVGVGVMHNPQYGQDYAAAAAAASVDGDTAMAHHNHPPYGQEFAPLEGANSAMHLPPRNGATCMAIEDPSASPPPVVVEGSSGGNGDGDKPPSLSSMSTSGGGGGKRTPEFLRQQWMARYGELMEYKRVHGNCNVPQREKQLGCWVSTQRTQYKLMLEGRPSQMTRQRIDLLNKLDFDWDPRRIFTRVYDPSSASHEKESTNKPEHQQQLGPNRNDRKWMQWYDELVRFQDRHGHCIVTRSANNSLGIWVQKQRKLYRDREAGRPSKILTDERIDLLNKIDFMWDVSKGSRPPRAQIKQRIPGLLEQRWNERYEQLRKYKEEYGDCLVPEKKPEFVKLGSWVSTQRKKGNSLAEDRRRMLDALDFEWNVNSDGKRSKVWNKKLDELRRYKAKQGHTNVVPSSDDASTASLAEWCSRQRYSYQHLWSDKYSPLTEERIRLLNSESFDWTRQARAPSSSPQQVDVWQQNFLLLKVYSETHGNCNVPRNHTLGQWVDDQRLAVKGMFEGKPSSMTWNQFSQLESIGFEFTVRASLPMSASAGAAERSASTVSQ